MRKVVARKRAMVENLVAFHLERYKESGAGLVMGSARLVDPTSIEVALNEGGNRRLTAPKLFLNFGTHASIPPIPGLAEAEPLTHIEALELDRLPDHLIVLGGAMSDSNSPRPTGASARASPSSNTAPGC